MACRDKGLRMPVMITAEDIACEAYGVVFPSGPVGEVPEPRAQHTHRVAAIRAMHSVVRKRRAFLLGGGQGRTSLVIFRADEAKGADELVKLGIDLPPWLKQVRPCIVGAITFTGMIYQVGGSAPGASVPNAMLEAAGSAETPGALRSPPPCRRHLPRVPDRR